MIIDLYGDGGDETVVARRLFASSINKVGSSSLLLMEIFGIMIFTSTNESDDQR